MPLVVEFTVEPFVDAAPGPHVLAAVEAAGGPGLTVEVGPFGTVVTGDDHAAVLDALDRAVRAAMAAGATRVAVQVSAEPA